MTETEQSSGEDGRLLQPIESSLRPGSSIKHFMPVYNATLMGLNGQFIWYHEDLVLFHRLYYRSANEAEEGVREQVRRYKRILDNNTDIDEWMDVGAARIRESIRSNDLAYKQARDFADHLLTVGLWSVVEQYVNRVATVMLDTDGFSETWPKTVATFSERGIDLKALTAYATVNELRLVNNAIKHSGKVSPRLLKFPAFAAGKEGTLLTSIQLPLQRYSDAVHQFVQHLIETVDDTFASGDG